jgi:tryptophanyl-tRNA synthetase
MSIITDSTPLEDPKNPDTCNVFALYRLLAGEAQIAEMRKNYDAGNYGYGHAKQALFELIIEDLATERDTFDYYMQNQSELVKKLQEGEEKARVIGHSVLARVKKKIGF